MSMNQTDYIRETFDPAAGAIIRTIASPVQVVRHGFVAGAGGGTSPSVTPSTVGLDDLPTLPSQAVGAYEVIYTELPNGADTDLAYTPNPVGMPAATTRPAGNVYAGESQIITFTGGSGGLYFLEYRNFPLVVGDRRSENVVVTN